MKKSNVHSESRSGADGRRPDPLETGGWTALRESLLEMVDEESEHVRQEVLTDNILCAVRPVSGHVRGFEDLWSGALVSWFRPVVVAGLLLIFLLAAYNVQQSHSTGGDMSTAERVLGLHPVTIAAAYDVELDAISE